MQNKVILYLGGGSMSGIFGAGVVTSLQKMNFYDKIEAIYAGSVGVMNAAYFLAKQTKLGSTIYYEDLTTNFIFPYNVPVGIIQRFWNKYINELPIKKICNAVDIDYVIDIIKNKKPLNTKSIKKQKINFYAKLLNMDNNKIIIVINEPIIRGLRHYAKNFLEGVVARSMHRSLFKFFINREKSVRNDIKLALSNERVLLIHPPKNNPTVPRTTDYSKLITTYEMGKKEAEKIKDFID